MKSPKHEWAVGDRAEVVGHQNQAQGTVVRISSGRYPVGVQFGTWDAHVYHYAPGQLKFLGRLSLPSEDPSSLASFNAALDAAFVAAQLAALQEWADTVEHAPWCIARGKYPASLEVTCNCPLSKRPDKETT